MLSESQDKLQEAENKLGKLSNFKPLLFERNCGKDHEDAAKSPAVSNNYVI